MSCRYVSCIDVLFQRVRHRKQIKGALLTPKYQLGKQALTFTQPIKRLITNANLILDQLCTTHSQNLLRILDQLCTTHSQNLLRNAIRPIEFFLVERLYFALRWIPTEPWNRTWRRKMLEYPNWAIHVSFIEQVNVSLRA